jgi:hypothetical protein
VWSKLLVIVLKERKIPLASELKSARMQGCSESFPKTSSKTGDFEEILPPPLSFSPKRGEE